jgi:hypothetical protein
MIAAHYPSYIAAAVSKENPCWCCVKGYKKDQHCETRYRCENCRVALCTAPYFQRYHMEADLQKRDGIEVSKWLRSV